MSFKTLRFYLNLSNQCNNTNPNLIYLFIMGHLKILKQF